MQRHCRLILFALLLATAGLEVHLSTSRGEDGGDLWSLQPLPQLDQLSAPGSLANLWPIDGYVGELLDNQQLSRAPRAPAYVQVRRLSLLLTGLPPNPAKVNSFVADPTDEHYARIVDDYLRSPHFGERWARHWMDVVRFAETYGYEWNFLVRDAWRYRDYLIRAFNQDLPYDQLIREHIAGDLIDEPRLNQSLGINESIIGTAFYRFGETGHDDCKIYPDISLDVMDNQIDTLFKAFQALTVSCARCHDHKLDAISQQDYYAQLGILASSRQVIHTITLPEHQADLRQDLLRIKHQIRDELARIWVEQAHDVSDSVIDSTATLLENLAGELEAADSESIARVEHPLFLYRKMANLENGKSWNQQWTEYRQQLVNEQERRTAANRNVKILADFSQGDHAGWAIEGVAAEHGFAKAGDFSVLYDGDAVLQCVLPAGFYSHLVSQKLNATIRSPLLPADNHHISYQVIGEKNSACRTVIDNCQLAYFYTNWLDQSDFSWSRLSTADYTKHRTYLEWTTLFDNQGYPNLSTPDAEYRESLANRRSYFGITKVVQHDAADVPLSELDAQLLLVETPVDNPRALVGRYRDIIRRAVSAWSRNEASEADIFWINFALQSDMLPRNCDASQRLSVLVDNFRVLEERLEVPQLVVGMADQGFGFDMRIFSGGDPKSPAAPAPRAQLSCLDRIVRLPEPLGGSGRMMIANSVAHPDNPLTGRVMANRIWHHLFGTGIVKSVDNFGAIGDKPSHPELLDYLARRFMDSGWSVKSLIREIVLSDTFRQTSVASHAGSEIDPENVLLHHFPARRLEAEVIRDSILAVSGRIDLTMYGPSINPHRAEDVEDRKLFSGPLDGDGRRSLYLKVTRMGPSQLLALFNLPDPGMTLGRRDSTNVPAQALGLLNHPFIHQQARRHAEELLQTSAGDFEANVNQLFMTLFGRQPTNAEMGRCEDLFAELSTIDGSQADQGEREITVWKEFIHALYNLKEFIYVI